MLLNMQDSTADRIGLHRTYYCGLVCYCGLCCYFWLHTSPLTNYITIRRTFSPSSLLYYLPLQEEHATWNSGSYSTTRLCAHNNAQFPLLHITCIIQCMRIARISSHVVQEYLSKQVSGHKSIPVSTNQLEVLSVNRIQGKSMLENRKLSYCEIMYQFLRRIP